MSDKCSELLAAGVCSTDSSHLCARTCGHCQLGGGEDAGNRYHNIHNPRDPDTNPLPNPGPFPPTDNDTDRPLNSKRRRHPPGDDDHRPFPPGETKQRKTDGDVYPPPHIPDQDGPLSHQLQEPLKVVKDEDQFPHPFPDNRVPSSMEDGFQRRPKRQIPEPYKKSSDHYPEPIPSPDEYKIGDFPAPMPGSNDNGNGHRAMPLPPMPKPEDQQRLDHSPLPGGDSGVIGNHQSFAPAVPPPPASMLEQRQQFPMPGQQYPYPGQQYPMPGQQYPFPGQQIPGQNPFQPFPGSSEEMPYNNPYNPYPQFPSDEKDGDKKPNDSKDSSKSKHPNEHKPEPWPGKSTSPKKSNAEIPTEEHPHPKPDIQPEIPDKSDQSKGNSV